MGFVCRSTLAPDTDPQRSAAALLHPYPYSDADNIFVFEIRNPESPRRGDRAFLMGAELAEFRSQVTAVGDLAFLEVNPNLVLTRDEVSRALTGATASTRTFAFFGVDALVGRTLAQ